MKISFFKGTSPQETSFANEIREVNFSELGAAVCSRMWSPFTFKSMHRKNEYFESTELLVLDIDKQVSLIEASTIFSEYKAIICTTRNHQKIKQSGSTPIPACDRFRVAIPLERIITSPKEYLATWDSAYKKWPFIDSACKDLARCYFPCTKHVYSFEGKTFPISVPSPELKKAKSPQHWQDLIGEQIVDGSRHTSILSVIGHLMRKKVNPYLVLELVRCWNAQMGRPPLATSEVTSMVNNIAGKELKRQKRGNHDN